eukprot:Colp12_sorted_trinity150504_noHs@23242
MAQHALPFLLFNLGGEMVYILQQRLAAQNITSKKGKQVVCDILSTLFADSFVDELFRPQQLYSVSSTRNVFDRLAHSSIMRLNESSMDKLFDLMAMGFKYQLVQSIEPFDIIFITLVHMDSIKQMVADNEQCVSLIEKTQIRLVKTYSKMTHAQLQSIKVTLLSFFQDKHTKVSLFLQEGYQKSDSTFVIPANGPIPRTVEMPGEIRYKQTGKQTKFPVADNLEPALPMGSLEVNGKRNCIFGENLYSKHPKKAAG